VATIDPLFDWCAQFVHILEIEWAKPTTGNRQSRARTLERLWMAIAEHRRTATPLKEILPEDLVPAADRLNAFINTGARDMPDRVSDLEAFAEKSLCAEARAAEL
jgi:hypothetical protein